MPGESTEALGAAAQEHGGWIVGGSVPERDGEKIYNTCTVWDPQGSLVAKHRKVLMMHFLFFIFGKLTFRNVSNGIAMKYFH